MAVEIYTDGGCKNNPGPGGWGVAVYSGGRCLQELHGHEAQTTNNKMELTALIQGLTLARDTYAKSTVTLFSDSTYCVQGYNTWLAGWRRNKWIKSNGKSVLNCELWDQVATLKDDLDAQNKVDVQHVRAHKGNVGNEHADRLSNKWRSSAESSKRPRVQTDLQADPQAKPSTAPGLPADSMSARFAAFAKEADAVRDKEFDALLAKQDITDVKSHFMRLH